MTNEELFEELHRLEQSMDETMTTIEQKIKEFKCKEGECRR